jgi:hypothetical protein
MVWSARGELDPSALEFSKLTKSPILWCIKKFIGTYPVFHSTCDEETAYIINLTKDQLKAAPADSLEELTRNDGQAYRDRAFDYYKVPRA